MIDWCCRGIELTLAGGQGERDYSLPPPVNSMLRLKLWWGPPERLSGGLSLVAVPLVRPSLPHSWGPSQAEPSSVTGQQGPQSNLMCLSAVCLGSHSLRSLGTAVWGSVSLGVSGPCE